MLAEVFATVGFDGFDVCGHLVLVEVFWLSFDGEFLGVGVFAFGEVGQALAGLLTLFGEAGVVVIDLFAVFVHGTAVVGGLLARGFTLFGDLPAVGVVFFAIFVGEDAEEVFEEGGTGFWSGGESESALLDEEVVELIDGGTGVFAGDFEGGGEVDFLAVTMEAADGDAAAEGGPDFLLGLFVGFLTEEVVDVVELVGREPGELRKAFLIYQGFLMYDFWFLIWGRNRGNVGALGWFGF